MKDKTMVMYDPQTGILLLGDEIYGKSIRSSHAQEFHESKTGGSFDDYLRGWIGTSRQYPRGIVHFAPRCQHGAVRQGGRHVTDVRQA